MKHIAPKLTVLFALTAASISVLTVPSFAMDPLHLLAQVNHLMAQDAGTRLEDVAKDQKKKAKAPSQPKKLE